MYSLVLALPTWLRSFPELWETVAVVTCIALGAESSTLHVRDDFPLRTHSTPVGFPFVEDKGNNCLKQDAELVLKALRCL